MADAPPPPVSVVQHAFCPVFGFMKSDAVMVPQVLSCEMFWSEVLQMASGNGCALPWQSALATAVFWTLVLVCPLRMLAIRYLTFVTVTVALAALQSVPAVHTVVK